ncbi:hypothetical protein P280DRAFT_387652, partial [Massarina eburnea CBS 473.64]
DASLGVHDLVYPACDSWRYVEVLRVEVGGAHASCAENLRRELAKMTKDLKDEVVRAKPLNLFIHVEFVCLVGIEGVGTEMMEVLRSVSRAGDYVVLRAEVECVAVMSACPNDL